MLFLEVMFVCGLMLEIILRFVFCVVIRRYVEVYDYVVFVCYELESLFCKDRNDCRFIIEYE